MASVGFGGCVKDTDTGAGGVNVRFVGLDAKVSATGFTGSGVERLTTVGATSLGTGLTTLGETTGLLNKYFAGMGERGVDVKLNNRRSSGDSQNTEITLPFQSL